MVKHDVTLAHEHNAQRRRNVARHVRKQSDFCGEILQFHKREGFDIEKLAEGYGIPVTRVNMPKSLAGFLYPSKRQTESGWEIVVNSNLSEKELRWTIAHELSHWVLDKNRQPPEFDDEQILPRMRFLHANQEDYVVETVSVRLNPDRTIRSAWTENDPFIDDPESIKESELRANTLAGYFLMPTSQVDDAFKGGKSLSEVAEQFAVTEAVLLIQISSDPRLRMHVRHHHYAARKRR